MKNSILRRLSLQSYLDESRQLGRASISTETRSKSCILFDHAERILGNSTSLTDQQLETYRVVYNTLFVEKYLSEYDQPRYIHYTNMPVLDRFLKDGEPVPLIERVDRARRALAIIVKSWHEHEAQHLSLYNAGKLPQTIQGYTTQPDAAPSIEHLIERERGLRRLIELDFSTESLSMSFSPSEMAKYPSDWHYFASLPDLQVSKLLIMPRSLWHDEFMFLAVIHATECCYAGIIAPIRSLPSAILKQDWIACTELVKSSLFFAEFLVKLWSIFDTMPVSHFFDGFLKLTGDASAIQSLRFQELDILTRGISSHKAAVLSRFPELELFSRWNPPQEATIRGLLEIADSSPGAAEFLSAANLLERDLYKWRAKHFGIARKYLPPTDVGTGEEGVPYLEKTFKNPTLSKGEVRDRTVGSSGLNCPVRLSSLYQLDKSSASLVVLRFTISDWTTESDANSAEFLASMVEQYLKPKGTTHKILDRYRDDFAPHPVPAERVIGAYTSSGALPDEPLSRFELSVAVATGSLVACCLDQKVSGELVVDYSRGGESFLDRTGKDQTCLNGETVIRDSKGVLFSFRQGADRRALPMTSQWRSGARVTSAIVLPRNFTYPHGQIEERLANVLAKFGCNNEGIWIINEY